jgi:hypothetical protein
LGWLGLYSWLLPHCPPRLNATAASPAIPKISHQFSEPLDAKPDVDAVDRDVDALDQQLDNARLLGREQLCRFCCRSVMKIQNLFSLDEIKFRSQKLTCLEPRCPSSSGGE